MRKNSLAMLGMFAMTSAMTGGMFTSSQDDFNRNDFAGKPDRKPTRKPTRGTALLPPSEPSSVIPKGLKPFIINVAGSEYTIYVLNAKNAKKKEISLNLTAYTIMGKHMFDYSKPSPNFSENIAGCRKAYEDAKKITDSKIKNFKETYVAGLSSENDLMFEVLSNSSDLTLFEIEFLKNF